MAFLVWLFASRAVLGRDSRSVVDLAAKDPFGRRGGILSPRVVFKLSGSKERKHRGTQPNATGNFGRRANPDAWVVDGGLVSMGSDRRDHRSSAG